MLWTAYIDIKKKEIPPYICAYTSEESGEVTVIEAEYKYHLPDVPKDILQILKETGVCMTGLNKRLMSEKIIHGKQVNTIKL